ncbi:magnesium transporter [Rhodovulum sp. DZ06]|uniref:magnesium transporter n=1 Tax=Rhodovulum sp. DZ06 TaxID=3425126 RepID=UPI003D3448D3
MTDRPDRAPEPEDAAPEALSARIDTEAPEERPEEREEPEDEFALEREVVQRVRAAVEAEDRETLLAEVEELHAADLADLLEQLGHDDRAAAVRLLGGDLDPDVFSELEDDVRDDVLEAMEPENLAAAAKELDADDVVYLVADLEDDQRDAVLDALDPVDRTAVEQALEYPEYTAGRLMRRELVAAPPFWTVGQMIDHLRSRDDLPDEFTDIILVDPALKPVDLVPLSRVMGAGRDRKLQDLARDDMRVLKAETSQEDVAYAFNQYHMMSAPVVDEDGRLVGVISIDDAMEALDEEAEEDLKLLAGVGDESLSDKVTEIVKARFPWLAVNLLTAILASLVIGMFDTTIEAIVALAILMPIVASMGGNAGTQTLTVAVRAIATRDLTAANMWRIVGRETLVGLLNGVAFAILIGVITLLWFGDPMLGGVLAAAMIVNLLVAGLAGILIPIALDKVGADPALASGTFVTTVTDVVGFFVFLGLAGAVLL